MIIILGIIVLVIVGFFVWSIANSAWYVPAVGWAVEGMVKLAQVKKGERVVDLGSGDGQVVIAMAKEGAEAYGYEINPFAYLISLIKIHNAGVSKHAHIYFGNFMNADLSQFDVITAFLAPALMTKLEKKLKKELKSNARVVSMTFPFPQAKVVRRGESLYVYSKSSFSAKSLA